MSLARVGERRDIAVRKRSSLWGLRIASNVVAGTETVMVRGTVESQAFVFGTQTQGRPGPDLTDERPGEAWSPGGGTCERQRGQGSGPRLSLWESETLGTIDRSSRYPPGVHCTLRMLGGRWPISEKSQALAALAARL